MTATIDNPTNRPLFSVVWVGRNQADWAEQSISALQSQSCSDFELLVQDCGTAEETIEVFAVAAREDRRIRILPKVADGLCEGLLNALRHCRGTYVAICPVEGRFAPNALKLGAEDFERYPDAGAICGTGFLIEPSGHSLNQVDIVTLFFTSYRPFLPAGFYRRQALEDCGIHSSSWLVEATELELCSRLATDFGIRNIDRALVEVADRSSPVHTLSTDPIAAVEERLQVVSRLFSVGGFFGPAEEPPHLEAMVNQLSVALVEFRALNLVDIEQLAYSRLLVVTQRLHVLLRSNHSVLRSLHRLFCTRSHNLGIFSTPLQKFLAYSFRLNERAQIHLEYQIWNCTFMVGYLLKRKVIARTLPTPEFHEAAPTPAEMLSDVYMRAGQQYESRGQPALAIEMWANVAPPNDFNFDCKAAQAMIKSPDSTDESIKLFQQAFVRRHIGEQQLVEIGKAAEPRPRGKIRIGYFCEFMHGDTIRYMMGRVLAAHDRSRFEVYGYATRSLPADIQAVFDVVRVTGTGRNAMSNDDFVSMVRNDDIDVFVELSGFSGENRFIAMSRRCAPVQVSYLNHTGSSQIPNVDYILSDEIGTPSGKSPQEFYSEKIYRLPQCFFCFDYRDKEHPPIVDPPSATRGYITFGCFSTGSKINSRLIELWAQLLHSVPDSVLRLQNYQFDSRDIRDFTTHRFGSFGISPDRFTLAKGVPRDALMHSYNHVDISLDTWPYCGGNTVAESLWMGVPVITLKGSRFSARYGASLLTAAGCANLVAETAEQYVDIATKLARDPQRLLTLRHELRRMCLENGLGDSERFSRRLEDAYIKMLASKTGFTGSEDSMRPQAATFARAASG